MSEEYPIEPFRLSTCPKCGWGYPDYYIPKGWTFPLCDHCGYFAGDDA